MSDWRLAAAEAYRRGELDRAADTLQRAVADDPTAAEPLWFLAQLAQERGDRTGARSWLNRATALAAAQSQPQLWIGLAAAWHRFGDRERMADAATRALRVAPEDAQARALFVEAVSRLRVAPPAVHDLLARALDEAWSGSVGLPSVGARSLLEAWPGDLLALTRSRLLLALLGSDPVSDPGLEDRLSEVRRTLLLHERGPAFDALAATLARQAFINEYAWPVAPEEAQAALTPPVSPSDLLRLACYRPLPEIADEASLRAWDSPHLADLIRQQLDEPAEERRLAAALPTLTAIDDDVSHKVREMYEANRYPRWTRPPAILDIPVDDLVRRRLPGVDVAPVPNASAPRVLVAGCGTGAHALAVARTYRGADVLAVDLSRASLGYAARAAGRLQQGNLTFAQADLLELDAGPFDVIESVGVLHHTADPAGALARLAAQLRPGGLFRLGLYSARARAGLAPAQALAAHYPATREGIRALRAAIRAAPPDDPVRQVLSRPDFYATSACRDLLQHVEEHLQTIDDIAVMLDGAGLGFLGFLTEPEILLAYRARFPDDPSGASLSNWAAFEDDNPAIFRGMYQLWAQRPAEG